MMTTILLPLLLGALAGGLIGVFAGWLARGRDEVIVEKRVVETIEKIVERPPDDVVQKRDQAQEILAQLQLLTMGVSEKIDAHTKRVGDINDELAAVSSDGSGVVVAIRRLVASNSAMQSQLRLAQEKLDEKATQLEEQQEEARTDPLTKLRNRRALDDEITRRCRELGAQGVPVALMMIDVDHFKKFNDTYGHVAGDEVLRTVGRVLGEGALAQRDLFAARYGGEEFVLLFAGQPLETAGRMGDAIRRRLEELPVFFDGQELVVTASAGIAEFRPGETIGSFIARADEALYAAKKSGRNCSCLQLGSEVRKITAVEVPSQDMVPTNDEFIRTLSRRIAEWRRGGVVLSLVVFRLDNLSPADAKSGRITPIVRDYFQHALREMDHVLPMAGDIFGILLPTAKLIDAARIAERMRGAIEHGDLNISLGFAATVSMGVAEVTAEDDGESLLLRARRALESASRRGGNLMFVNDGVYSKPGQDLLDLDASQWAAIST